MRGSLLPPLGPRQTSVRSEVTQEVQQGGSCLLWPSSSQAPCSQACNRAATEGGMEAWKSLLESGRQRAGPDADGSGVQSSKPRWQWLFSKGH